MPCNYSGYFNASFVASFGIADFDWSNAKDVWVNDQPMRCEEDLVAQAAAVKALNTNTHVCVFLLVNPTDRYDRCGCIATLSRRCRGSHRSARR